MFFDSTMKNCLTIKAHCYRTIQKCVFANAMLLTFSISAFLLESIEQENQTPRNQTIHMQQNRNKTFLKTVQKIKTWYFSLERFASRSKLETDSRTPCIVFS